MCRQLLASICYPTGSLNTLTWLLFLCLCIRRTCFLFFLNTQFTNSEFVLAPGSSFCLSPCAPIDPIKRISNLIVCVFPGLPDGLPDTVCPAAMLQHVLRPPQQHRETNSTVCRPLARRLPLQHIHAPFPNVLSSIAPSLLLTWWIYSIANKKEKKLGMMGMAEERNRLKEMDMHLPIIPLFLHTRDGMTDLLRRKTKRRETARFCSWRRSEHSPF